VALAIPFLPVAETGRFSGKRLRYWREERGLSQRQLAALVGKMDGAAISRMETVADYEPVLRTWRRIAAALQIQPHQLTEDAAPKDRDVEEMLSRMLPAADVRQVMRQIRLYQEEHRRRRK
jgi:transcriptional regulator with XRE-family HTH domain